VVTVILRLFETLVVLVLAANFALKCGSIWLSGHIVCCFECFLKMNHFTILWFWKNGHCQLI